MGRGGTGGNGHGHSVYMLPLNWAEVEIFGKVSQNSYRQESLPLNFKR
jgi:hypothetical protein